MTKVREAGSCAQALWEFVTAVGRASLGDKASEGAARAEGIARVGQVLGVDEGVVRNMLNPDRPEQISLERAGLLQRTFGIDLLARWLAIEAGGTFIPLPDPAGDMERLTASGVRAAGETAAKVIEALSDTSESGSALSEGEARDLAQESRKVVETFSKITTLADQAVRKARAAAKNGRR